MTFRVGKVKESWGGIHKTDIVTAIEKMYSLQAWNTD